MTESIQQARRDVHKAFEAALASADSEREQLLWEFERRLWTQMMRWVARWWCCSCDGR